MKMITYIHKYTNAVNISSPINETLYFIAFVFQLCDCAVPSGMDFFNTPVNMFTNKTFIPMVHHIYTRIRNGSFLTNFLGEAVFNDHKLLIEAVILEINT